MRKIYCCYIVNQGRVWSRWRLSSWENSEILPWVLFVKNACLIIGKYFNKHVRGGLAVLYTRRFIKFIFSFKTGVSDFISAKYSGEIKFFYPGKFTVLLIKNKFSYKNKTWDISNFLLNFIRVNSRWIGGAPRCSRAAEKILKIFLHFYLLKTAITRSIFRQI